MILNPRPDVVGGCGEPLAPKQRSGLTRRPRRVATASPAAAPCAACDALPPCAAGSGPPADCAASAAEA